MSAMTTPGRRHDNGGPSDADLYRSAVEEYRFQAQFNWSRTQYLLAFNAAILAAGVALAHATGALAVVVFALGAVAAALTWVVQDVQHAYYRRARDRMRKFEQRLELVEPTDTTGNLAGVMQRVTVTRLVKFLLGAIAAANLAAIVVVLV